MSASLQPSAAPGWQPPAEFDEYRLVRPLGHGRTGSVYLAHDTLLERPVAVKFIPASGSDALARFLNEARASARIQHPNVVAIYRVGQLDDRAYLVSEYTRGVGLERLKKPLPWEKVLPLARDLARGLAAAHRKGVLHRDIKPGNALLTETGQVKLLDFGLATFTDAPAPLEAQTPSGLVGTPWYMSPEAWRAEDHTARSDLYSLGAVLFELLTGKPPFDAPSVPLLFRAVQEAPSPRLLALAPEVDHDLAELVQRCLARDPLERPASAEALVDALELIEAKTRPRPQVPEGNPYRGLRAFESEDRALFFGRRRDVGAILERLRSDALVVLTGDSGVGKSSLAAAGVLPALAEGELRDERRYAVLRLVPGRRPLTALALAVGGHLKEKPDALEALLRSDPEALARRLVAGLKPNTGVVLYLDQLEELVTLSPTEDAHAFSAALAPLAHGVAGIRLLASARSDFLTRLAAMPSFGEAIARTLFLVAPLGPSEVREAIVGPAQIKGARFESDALIQTLVDSTVNEGGGLPLLQFALAQLWNARDTERNAITAASLEAVGGVGGALARHADGVIEALSDEDGTAARVLLLRLVTGEVTRSRRSGDELTDGDPRFVRALEALVQARLVVGREGEDGGTYEVAHEALLKGWGRLARWIEQDRELRELRERIESSAREWERAGRARDALWSERALIEAERLVPEQLSEREQRFLAASQRNLRRRRWVRVGVVAIFVVGIAAAVAAVKIRASLLRTQLVVAELQLASNASAQAKAAEQVERSLRDAAFRAFDQRRPEEGEEKWAESLARRTQVDAHYATATDALERGLAIAPQDARVREALADVLFARAERAERDGHAAVLQLLLNRLKLVDESGERWRRWTAPAAVTFVTSGPGQVRIHRYDPAPAGRWEPRRVAMLDVQKGTTHPLEPGSYLFVFEGEAGEVTQALSVRRGESLRTDLRVPPTVPEGFVYVPPGRFHFGSGDEESIRTFLNASPMRDVTLPGYFIARHETTWADYLEFLGALEPEAREERLPRGGNTGMLGGLRLTQERSGRWRLEIQPTTQILSAAEGEKLRYPDRALRAEVDWLRAPVVGISWADARAYAEWLDETGRVPGARLCDEREWERAARGGDGRDYPHGNAVAPDDANFDLTYGKRSLAFGPDEVGSHPASQSPFGIHDAIGNVWEWTESASGSAAVVRGSSYYFGLNSLKVANREIPDENFRDLTVGMRLCATVPQG